MQAFTALVTRYQHPVIRFCYRMTDSMQDAEDIAQETFLRLYGALRNLRPDNAFTTVLFCIARNAALNHLRGRRRHERRVSALEKASAGESSAAGPYEYAQSQDNAALLRKAVAELPAEYREALVLREYNGFDYKEIAEILSCPVGTVRSRLARAREQVRRHLLHYGDDML